MTRDEKIDLVFFGLVISWPFMLGLGAFLYLEHVPLWSFFIFYCLASSPGILKAAREILNHGIHNDR